MVFPVMSLKGVFARAEIPAGIHSKASNRLGASSGFKQVAEDGPEFVVPIPSLVIPIPSLVILSEARNLLLVCVRKQSRFLGPTKTVGPRNDVHGGWAAWPNIVL